MPFDLFGEIPVTVDEIAAWVEVVAGITRASWRLDDCVTHWNVAQKIRNWKLQHRKTVYDAAIAAEIERKLNKENG